MQESKELSAALSHLSESEDRLAQITKAAKSSRLTCSLRFSDVVFLPALPFEPP